MLLELGSRAAREMFFFGLVVNTVSFLSASSEQVTGRINPCSQRREHIFIKSSERYAGQYLEASSSSFLISELTSDDRNLLVSTLRMICTNLEPKNFGQGFGYTDVQFQILTNLATSRRQKSLDFSR
jgi:hypothetical protein